MTESTKEQATVKLITQEPELPSPTVVVDTNVILDVHSCHDVTEAFDKHFPRLKRASMNHKEVTYRLARAKESMLLALYFNKTVTTTYNLHDEPIVLLTSKVPPAPTGGVSWESDFTTYFVHFVKDRVLSKWTIAMPTERGNESKDEADDALIAYALTNNLPLITNEGYRKSGIFDDGMRAKAKQAGVHVFTPKEFCKGKIDETEVIEDFFRRFEVEGHRFLEERRHERGEDGAPELFDLILGYYGMILRGEFAKKS
jgi:rRNA-processing protein FCF1